MGTTDILDQRAKLVLFAKAHFAADMLIKGTYGRGSGKSFKGCSVGCLAHDLGYRESKDGEIHTFVAAKAGYPAWLVYLQDTIFEGLPNGPQGENSRWHVQLAETIATLPPDYDWGFALHRVHVAILRISYRTAGSAQEVVQRVLDLHERAGCGEDISAEIWSAAESSARSAAWSAWSPSVTAAARAAVWSAGAAAWSAAWSAARAAWSAEYQELRDAVLDALREPAPVKQAA